MASVALADMLGAYTVTQAQLIECLQGCGQRCDPILTALAPYEATANDTPVALGDYAGTYTLDTAAKRDAVLAAASPRGQSLFQKLITYQV